MLTTGEGYLSIIQVESSLIFHLGNFDRNMEQVT